MSTRTFTPRQRQVVALIARGRTLEEIGRELGIGTRTVVSHVEALRVKLGGVSRRRIPVAYLEATGIDPFTIVVESGEPQHVAVAQ